MKVVTVGVSLSQEQVDAVRHNEQLAREQQSELVHIFSAEFRKKLTPEGSDTQRLDVLLKDLRKCCTPRHWASGKHEQRMVELYLKAVKVADICRQYMADQREARLDQAQTTTQPCPRTRVGRAIRTGLMVPLAK
jgi:hypothetical protein